MQRLMEELEHKQHQVTVYCGSQSALHIARNPSFHSRTKHIGVQYHFAREVVEEGSVVMQKTGAVQLPSWPQIIPPAPRRELSSRKLPSTLILMRPSGGGFQLLDQPFLY